MFHPRKDTKITKKKKRKKVVLQIFLLLRIYHYLLHTVSSRPFSILLLLFYFSYIILNDNNFKALYFLLLPYLKFHIVSLSIHRIFLGSSELLSQNNLFFKNVLQIKNKRREFHPSVSGERP